MFAFLRRRTPAEQPVPTTTEWRAQRIAELTRDVHDAAACGDWDTADRLDAYRIALVAAEDSDRQRGGQR